MHVPVDRRWRPNLVRVRHTPADRAPDVGERGHELVVLALRVARRSDVDGYL